ncbi:MAG: hypothetical protein NT090_05610, partial [Acidobacteria bacterium]|nr:hypothetical protein [Acidobacteriota bacterium]
MNGLSQRWTPGRVRTHELNVSFERRFSRGFNLNLAYTMVKNNAADFFWNEFDANPSWRPSNNSRPHRLTGNAIYEFPFGRGRRFLKKGPLGCLAGGFQIGATYELQPGALIDWGNLFYYGKLEDIDTGSRTLGRWFNTAGFERTSTNAPASFHRRVFPTRIEGLRADIMNNWNASAQREFKLRESVALRFRL